MSRLLKTTLSLLLLPLLLLGCNVKEENGLVIGPPPTDETDPKPDDKPDDTPEDNPDDKPDQPVEPSGEKPVIAVYFTEYTPSSEFPTLEDVKCFTHINVGHARFKNPKTGDGGLEIKSPGPDYMRRLAAYKTDYPELKLLLFVGGWGKNADGFSVMAKDPEKRALFCSECVRLCNEYNLDGVDLDWEYPTYAAKTYLDDGGTYYNGADPADKQNFTTLVKDLREALGPDKLISFAAASDDFHSGDYMEYKKVLDYVDYINVMTYSMGDPCPSDPSKQRHNSPLYTNPDLFYNSRGGADCIEGYHNEQGVPYDRMNYGIGFYGHGDGTVYPSSVAYPTAKDALTKGYYTKDGKQKSVTGYNKRWWDEKSKSVYLGDDRGVMYASYEDVESIGWRVKYAKEKGLLGAFAWEYREDDSEGTLRKAFYELMMDGVVENPDTGTDTPGEEDPGEEDPGTTPVAGPDLSASATANCYIVSAPGTYKFKTVKGNSSTSVGSVSKAELLWETTEGMVLNVTYGANYIYFSTPETLKPGNALIAAKNSSGTILWSWHIWIPKTRIGGDLYGLSFYTTMSRNLGALEDASASAGADSYGLLYQWGRKDPFPCKTATDKTTSAMTIGESVAHPTQFVAVDGTWMSSVDQSVWGDKATKTIYDPCPAGYKVPMREDVGAIFQSDDISGSTGWQYASGKAFAIGEPQTWFPYAGYLDVTGAYVNQGSQTKIWNSHMDGDNYHGYGIFVTDQSSTRSSQKAAQAGSIRCISEAQATFTNEAGMPVQGSYKRTEFSSSKMNEISGLCLSMDKDFLWGVGDGGNLYKITGLDGDGTTLSVEEVLSHDDFYGGTYTDDDGSVHDYWYDMEGITMDPATGDLYIAYEPKRVFRIKSPYTTVERKLFDVEEAKNMSNSGMEGIAWYKGDLYVGSQSGATLWRYKVNGTKVWKKQLGQYAPGITEVGDLCYDSQTDLLWVIDSEARKIFVFDGEVTKLKAIYDVSAVGNAESVCVDHARSCVWVGDDGSTSKIYKYSFTGL